MPRIVEFDLDLVDNPALSFRARGVLLHLLDTPGHTRLGSIAIAAAGTEGRDQIRKSLVELESVGFVRRTGKLFWWDGNPTHWLSSGPAGRSTTT